jgi:hypothetical protein
MTFIDSFLEGKATLDEIDDFVDRWHESGADDSIYKFLGMTWNEYKLWVEDPTSLLSIIDAHRKGK